MAASFAVGTPASAQPRAALDPICQAADLGLSFGHAEGAAGTVYRAVQFTNYGDNTCVLQGFPGVSYVDGDGNQVGAAARRDGPAGSLVTLDPGATASAIVGFVQIGLFDPAVCQPTPVAGIQVYPPDSTESLFLEMPGQQGCAGDVSPSAQLKVLPMTDDPGA
ncbi:DUF4232 domain-containing protein [Solihabitans fulvus]|nr:DUF4232 domain-containing protein [Solihabitans fulvus]